MAPKIQYDAAVMQAKANKAVENDIENVAKEGTVLPLSAEVTSEYLGVLTTGLIATIMLPSATRKRPGTITPQSTVPVCRSNGRQPLNVAASLVSRVQALLFSKSNQGCVM